MAHAAAAVDRDQVLLPRYSSGSWWLQETPLSPQFLARSRHRITHASKETACDAVHLANKSCGDTQVPHSLAD
jgi:hypothetical protein